MKNFSKKRTKKGMTLIEIIVSLAVLSVLTLLLVTTSKVINNYVRSANNVNGRVVRQAPIAEIGDNQRASEVDNNVTIKVNNNINIPAKGYVVLDPDAEDGKPGGDLKMQYIKIDESKIFATTTSPAGP